MQKLKEEGKIPNLFYVTKITLRPKADKNWLSDWTEPSIGIVSIKGVIERDT